MLEADLVNSPTMRAYEERKKAKIREEYKALFDFLALERAELHNPNRLRLLTDVRRSI